MARRPDAPERSVVRPLVVVLGAVSMVVALLGAAGDGSVDAFQVPAPTSVALVPLDDPVDTTTAGAARTGAATRPAPDATQSQPVFLLDPSGESATDATALDTPDGCVFPCVALPAAAGDVPAGSDVTNRTSPGG